jgi:aminopeptidase N
VVVAIPLSASAAPAPGAPGAGDPYFPTQGNGGYDAQSYQLRVAFTPSTERLSGTAHITAVATQDLSRFDLDLRGLTVRGVLVDGHRAAWRRYDHELVVTPPHGLPVGTSFTTTVQYDGVPRTLPDGSGFIHTRDGAVVVGQPEVASTWFPDDDHPSDKATYSFAITVPRGLQALANGVLVGHRGHGSWTTWSWRERSPMASYLATATMGHFSMHAYRHDGLWMLDAIDPSLRTPASSRRTPGAIASAAFARQGTILDFLAHRFGPYPFDAAGGIVDNADIGFALENQTRPVYDPSFFTDARSANSVVVHELTHQWFGDSLAVRDWKDIWLNEGFATYAEWLWSERQGHATAQQQFDAFYQGIPADSSFWDLRIGDPGRGHLFDEAVYDRGAMALHELRRTVGDAMFFTILRTWAAEHAGGNVTVAEFVQHAEQVSGQDLDDLFSTWLYSAGRPTLAP